MDELATAAGWRGWGESPRRLQRQLVELLVGKSERRLVEGDLRSELRAVAASAPAEPFKPLAGVGESFLCEGALPFELALCLGEQASAALASCLCERERLGGGACECSGGTLRRVERVGLACVRVVLPLDFGEVEACLCSCAGAGDVAPFAEGSLIVEEDEGAVDGGALGGVAGEGVAVLKVVGGVRERHETSRARVGTKRDRGLVEVDDRSARAVADAEARVVAAAEDAVADAELAFAELEGVGTQAAGADEQRPCCVV